MKVIIMHKGKLQVFITLLALMGLLFVIGELVKNEFRYVSFMQNNIKDLKAFEALEGDISYKLPSEWTTSQETLPGKQIVYHNNFKSNDLTVHGFVQVWNNEEDLKDFLDRSRKVSEQQNKIKDYNIKDININDKKGYLINYVITSNNIKYTAYEYFIKYKNGFLRFSFFTKSSDFNEGIRFLYETILKTVNLKEI